MPELQLSDYLWLTRLYIDTYKKAVLQKQEEENEERSVTALLRRLDGHSKQFCDECCLSQAVSFSCPFSLGAFCLV
jgi:hypothetical protein